MILLDCTWFQTDLIIEKLEQKGYKNFVKLEGYEIHCGQSDGSAFATPFAEFNNTNGTLVSDGFISEDGLVVGTYLHGLFDKPEPTQAILSWVKPELTIKALDLNEHREQQLERLAKVCEQHLAIDNIINITQEFARGD